MADSTHTDPRYHAAYQRGYAGPQPTSRAPEEQRFRRPRRPAQRAEPAILPERRCAARSTGFEIAEEDDRGALSSEAEATPPTTAAPPVVPRRVPVTLALSGVALIVLGALCLWQTMQGWYSFSSSSQSLSVQQYLRELANLLSGPALTVGFVALALAVVAQIVRSAQTSRPAKDAVDPGDPGER